MDYQSFMNQFSALSSEEAAYKKLWEHASLPPFPAFINKAGSSLADITLTDDLYFPSDALWDYHVEKHTRYLPTYIHDHQFLEIGIVLRGSCIQELYERKYMMSASDMIIISPNTYHAISVYDDESIVMNLLIKSTAIESVLRPFAVGDTTLNRYFASVIDRKPICPCVMIHGVEEVFPSVASLYQEGRRSNLLGRSFLAQMFALLLLLPERAVCCLNQGDRKDARLTAILHYIKENPDKVTLSALADTFGLSPAYLSAVIHDSTGSTFTELLRRRKMELSLSLLSSGIPMTTGEIARKIGYGSAQHFCRTFRKCYGCTPTEVRSRKVEHLLQRDGNR